MGLLLCVAACSLARPALADPTADQLPSQVAGAVIVDKLDSQVPLGLKFKDESGNDVTLDKYFHQGKPVLLTLVYFKCPMLCTLVVNGMVDSLKQIKYDPGKDFNLVTVSFNPLETPALANVKRRNYLDLYGRAGADQGWHFLTGQEDQIRQLADAVGFGYKWNPDTQTFAHQAGLFVLTPEGKVSRTLYGVDFDPTTLKGSLLQAGEGAIGTPLDKVYFACCQFDANAGKYTISVMNVTRLICTVLVVVFMIALIGYFQHERVQRRRHASAEEAQAGLGGADDFEEPAAGGWEANSHKGQ
jgi:protein SCO1/2